MSEPRFTPGPWRCNEKDFLIRAGGDESGERGGIKIAQMAISEILSAEDDFNAHLIAAAPDLYEALAEVVALNAHAAQGNTLLKRLCEAALSKARGES